MGRAGSDPNPDLDPDHHNRADPAYHADLAHHADHAPDPAHHNRADPAHHADPDGVECMIWVGQVRGTIRGFALHLSDRRAGKRPLMLSSSSSSPSSSSSLSSSFITQGGMEEALQCRAYMSSSSSPSFSYFLNFSKELSKTLKCFPLGPIFARTSVLWEKAPLLQFMSIGVKSLGVVCSYSLGWVANLL